MKATAFVVLLLVAPALCLACGQPPPKEQALQLRAGRDCKALLLRIRDLRIKADWPSCVAQQNPVPQPRAEQASIKGIPAPPPPPYGGSAGYALGMVDPAECKLLDPDADGTDACLIDAIADTRAVGDPNCPRMMDKIALGDLAFFVLNDRHNALWEMVLPKETDGTSNGYYRIVNGPGGRAELQRKARAVLLEKGSPQPKRGRGKT